MNRGSGFCPTALVCALRAGNVSNKEKRRSWYAPPLVVQFASYCSSYRSMATVRSATAAFMSTTTAAFMSTTTTALMSAAARRCVRSWGLV